MGGKVGWGIGSTCVVDTEGVLEGAVDGSGGAVLGVLDGAADKRGPGVQALARVGLVDGF